MCYCQITLFFNYQYEVWETCFMRLIFYVKNRPWNKQKAYHYNEDLIAINYLKDDSHAYIRRGTSTDANHWLALNIWLVITYDNNKR